MMQSSFKKKIINIIRTYRKQGYTVSQIRSILEKQGYPQHLTEEFLAKAEHPIKNEKIIIAILIIVITIAVIPLVYWFLPKGQSCTDISCFLKAANECGKASLKQDVKGTIFELQTNNCQFSKKVLKIAAEEPQEINNILKGTSMTCSFAKEAFPEDLVTTLSKTLEQCDGSLKEAIQHIQTSLAV